MNNLYDLAGPGEHSSENVEQNGESQVIAREAAPRSESRSDSRPDSRPDSRRGPHVTFPDQEPRTDPQAGTRVQLSAEQLVKSYRKGKLQIPVLRGVDFAIHDGEFVSIVGQSGSGKSTLLHLLGTLDLPDEGEIHFDGRRIDNLPAGQRDRLRNLSLGMIFQFYHLLPELTMLENVLLPQMISCSVLNYWRRRRTLRQRAEHLLEMVGLSHRLKHRPRELSGGEMQRAAIARALIADPQVLLADEPTGNLDEKTGQGIMDILRTLNLEHGLSIVMVTHDMALARSADRCVRLSEGQVS